MNHPKIDEEYLTRPVEAEYRELRAVYYNAPPQTPKVHVIGLPCSEKSLTGVGLTFRLIMAQAIPWFPFCQLDRRRLEQDSCCYEYLQN